MSSINSSKSGQSNQKDTKNKITGSIYGYDDETNPFKVPPDEKIFTFKEEEKERKVEEKEKNKNLKICF